MGRVGRAAELLVAAGIIAGALFLAYALRRWEPVGEAAEEAAGHGERIGVQRVDGTVRVTLDADLVELAGISTVPVRKALLPSVIRAPASLRFARGAHYRVAARFTARVDVIHRDVGELVRPGELLCTLQSDEVARTKAELLRNLARYEAAAKTLDRLVSLQKTKLIKQQDLIDARRALQEADVAALAARRQLEAWGLAPGEVDRIVGRRDLSAFMPLRSPIQGWVVQVWVMQGETVQPGDPLMEVADASVLWAEIQVTEADSGRIQEGQQVEFNTATSPAWRPINGTVFFVSPSVDERTRKVTVLARLANDDKLYRAGMFGEARIVVERPTERLLVPAEAVLEADGVECVFVQHGQGEYELRVVRAGPRRGDEREIRYGLLGDERVVVQGGFFLLAELLRRQPDWVRSLDTAR